MIFAFTEYFNSLDRYLQLIKTDILGEIQWTREYYPPVNHRVFDASMAPLQDGGYIIISDIVEVGLLTNETDIFLIRTDASGDTRWTKFFPSVHGFRTAGIIELDNQELVIAGTWNENAGSYSDAFLWKLAPDGTLIWEIIYNRGDSILIHGLDKTYDNGFILTGRHKQSNGAYLAKIDDQGNREWEKFITEQGHYYSGKAILTASDESGFVIAGQWSSGSVSRIWIAKTNNAGDLQWSNKTTGRRALGETIVEAPGNTYVLTGNLINGVNGQDLWLEKFNENGYSLWSRLYGGGRNDRGYLLSLTMDNGFVITGETYSFPIYSGDIYFIKTSGNGLMPIEPEEDENELIPEVFHVEQNYPNPFNPTTLIRYSIARSETVLLTVYNLMGEKIQTLVNEVQPVGEYTAFFDAGNLPSGVYFYTLQAGGFSTTRKMVLMR